MSKITIIMFILAGLYAFFFFWLFDKVSPVLSALIAFGIIAFMVIVIKVS